jgi:2-methylisocitrate lyase-like PEP mutase family enzyme
MASSAKDRYSVGNKRSGGSAVPETYQEAVGRKRRQFREILNRDKMTVMVGGFSPVYARCSEEAGFECFFVAGSQMSAYLLGVPDVGVIGLRDVADHVRHINATTDIPIFVDTDTGFGNVVNVDFTVREIIRTGVAGMQIEDQEAPKKSGTQAGRRCIPVEEAVGKYRAAVAARDECDPDFVICARCDLLGAEGSSFDEAVERSIAYVKDGGVDFVWLNSVQTREEIAEATRRIPAPVLIIWGGPDPAPTWEEYQALGARIVLYPTICANVGLNATWQALHDLNERGAPVLTEISARAREHKYGSTQVRLLFHHERIEEIEARFLSADDKRNYDDTWGHAGIMVRDGKTLDPEEEIRQKADKKSSPSKSKPKGNKK